MINLKNDVDRFTSDDKKSYHTTLYLEIFYTIQDKVERLAAIEEIIMQKRCLNADFNIKLSTLREYVYARCPFYRRNKSTKDIRVLIGRTDLLEPNNQNPTLDDFYKNEGIMKYTKNKLLTTMNNELETNILKYNKTYYMYYDEMLTEL